MPHPQGDDESRVVDVLAEALAELHAGGAIDPVGYRSRNPDLPEDLPALLETMRSLDSAAEQWRGRSAVETAPPTPGSLSDGPAPALHLEQVGRYRILDRV